MKRRRSAGHRAEPRLGHASRTLPKVARTDSFARDLKSLPREIQNRTETAILRLVQNPSHPSLRVKKMQGAMEVWEASVTKSYRITFQRAGDAIILRRVGTHDILKKEAR